MQAFRHTCEQGEGMEGYGWDEYDIRTGGKQTIHDTENHLDITTQFVKVPGGSHGGNWGVRVSGALRKDAPKDMVSTVVFYTGLEGLGHLQLANKYDPQGYEGAVTLQGETGGLGPFKFEITDGPASNVHPTGDHPVFDQRPLDRTMAKSLMVQEQALWQAKPVMFQEMKRVLEDSVKQYGNNNSPPPWQVYAIGTNEPKPGNLHLFQKVFKGSFQFDILFSSASAPVTMTSQKLGEALKDSSTSFADRYKNIFKATGIFAQDKYDAFSKSMFSNLLGGVGYFWGDQVIDRSYASEYEEENEGFWRDAAEAQRRNSAEVVGGYELFSAIPSRPFFPRGFLWDEGFHLLPILDWDLGVTIEILRSWFNTMDEDGWIPREQILGPEARSKVPIEFQTQYPHYANPPTLFLVLENVLKKLQSDSMTAAEKDQYTSDIRSLYPLLKRNYAWYRKTQWGDIKSYDREAFSTKEAYRWRGRTETHVLTSGLDDYPRPQPPHPGELHIDLISWMGMMTRALHAVAAFVGESDDAKEFSGYFTAISRNIDDLHWHEAAKTYCDATIDDYEESYHVCHKGYMSIFPFLTGMLPPDHPHLEATLDLIRSPDELWSPYGIRSLSLKDSNYGTGENYWRSPIWMNINYLVVDNLLKTAQAKGPHQEKARAMYNELRTNLVETVYKSWKETGFAWEQFNPDTGAGQRTQHFTGWTSLVVKIMCMPDLTRQTHQEL
ncbi:MAG: Processing alpha glucosidase I [Chrysothrix sp. TS-e1954]|nr:MAG: Processing alpha glucosidase I [Chrysothrix sp. TS-e1954]